ncbi:MAG: hypothetical protein AAGC95_05155 [Pseudomonadota bacterium]
MGQVERVFGVFLLIIMLGAGAYVAFNGVFGGGGGGGQVSTPAKGASSAVLSSSADGGALSSMASKDAICSCYDEAYKLAVKAETTSPGYAAGFQRCRGALGVDGGAAWTAGWEARKDSARVGGCKRYLKSINY